MKVGDLVKYWWNKEERPNEVEPAVVLKTGIVASTEYIEIKLVVPEDVPPLRVPYWKLEVISESR